MNEEQSLLHFINNYFKLEFAARLSMLKEKAFSVIRLRNDEENSHVEENELDDF
jgi:hypothetical protein